MKKYYLVSTLVWFSFTLFALVYAVWKVYTEGYEKGWWLFLAFGLALFLFIKRYRTWKNAPNENNSSDSEN